MKLHVTTTVKATSGEVWERLFGPEHLLHWYFAHESWWCPSASFDPVAGGSFSIRMEARDGSFGFDFTGDVLEAEKPNRLVARLGDGRSMEIQVSEVAEGTRVDEWFEPESENPLDMQQAGWQAILNQFKTYSDGLSR
jgi:uncharacterized protein YndB with AHSA1/START domain